MIQPVLIEENVFNAKIECADVETIQVSSELGQEKAVQERHDDQTGRSEVMEVSFTERLLRMEQKIELILHNQSNNINSASSN